MTRINGAYILAAPCCGKRYSTPRYASMSFWASEYWTDGWLHGAQMKNDVGLRRCECGKFLFMRDFVEIETVESTSLARIPYVSSELLPECIATADRMELEVAARLQYWRDLNHEYRKKYRQHRDNEEAVAEKISEIAKKNCEAGNPDHRSWWDKLRGRKAPSYISQAGPFTCPVFEPSTEQLKNMQRLVELLLAHNSTTQHPYSALNVAELFREQGRFAEAEESISAIAEHERGVASKLVSDLISERQTAPVRYMM